MTNKTNTRDAIESDFIPVISGVSQNTELGPLMFVFTLVVTSHQVFTTTVLQALLLCCSWKAFQTENQWFHSVKKNSSVMKNTLIFVLKQAVGSGALQTFSTCAVKQLINSLKSI